MKNLFGDEITDEVVSVKKRTSEADKQKRKWQNAFQKWSNKKSIDADTEHYGKCGYGSICDFCSDNSYGRPCVRALNEMLKETNIQIDYNNISDEYFEMIF